MSAGNPPGPAPSPPPVVRRRGDRGKIYTVVGVIVVAALIVGVGAGTSWYGLKSTSSSSGCPTAITLQGQGAAFPSSIVLQWAAEFGGDTGNPVNYGPSGAGQGITELTDKLVDFAVTDEGLNASQSSGLQSAVGSFLTLPVTAGAVVMIYNIPGLSSKSPLNLTPTQMAGIYLGLITTWNSTALTVNNPGLNKSTSLIEPVYRSDAAGMTYVVTNLMSDWNSTWRNNPSLGTTIAPDWNVLKFPGLTPASGNSGVLNAVKSPNKGYGAIGYTDLYDASVKGDAMAHIQNSYGYAHGGGYIVPTVTNTTSAIDDVYNATAATLPLPTGDWSQVSWVNASGQFDYPLATIVYILAPLNPTPSTHTATSAEAAALRWWIDWVATQGQFYSRAYFPFPSPPAPLLKEDQNATAKMTFNGNSFPLCT